MDWPEPGLLDPILKLKGQPQYQVRPTGKETLQGLSQWALSFASVRTICEERASYKQTCPTSHHRACWELLGEPRC